MLYVMAAASLHTCWCAKVDVVFILFMWNATYVDHFPPTILFKQRLFLFNCSSAGPFVNRLILFQSTLFSFCSLELVFFDFLNILVLLSPYIAFRGIFGFLLKAKNLVESSYHHTIVPSSSLAAEENHLRFCIKGNS